MINQWNELGRYLLSPEEYMGESECRRFRDCPVLFMSERCRRVAVRLAETQAAGLVKTVLWLGVAIGAGLGLGQLQ